MLWTQFDCSSHIIKGITVHGSFALYWVAVLRHIVMFHSTIKRSRDAVQVCLNTTTIQMKSSKQRERKVGKPSPFCWKICVTNGSGSQPINNSFCSQCLSSVSLTSQSHSVLPRSSACLFSFHETLVRLRDPLVMPKIRGVYSGSLTDHKEIN